MGPKFMWHVCYIVSYMSCAKLFPFLCFPIYFPRLVNLLSNYIVISLEVNDRRLYSFSFILNQHVFSFRYFYLISFFLFDVCPSYCLFLSTSSKLNVLSFLAFCLFIFFPFQPFGYRSFVISIFS